MFCVRCLDRDMSGTLDSHKFHIEALCCHALALYLSVCSCLCLLLCFILVFCARCLDRDMSGTLECGELIPVVFTRATHKQLHVIRCLIEYTNVVVSVTYPLFTRVV
jgi:hypothetical protein